MHLWKRFIGPCALAQGVESARCWTDSQNQHGRVDLSGTQRGKAHQLTTRKLGGNSAATSFIEAAAFFNMLRQIKGWSR